MLDLFSNPGSNAAAGTLTGPTLAANVVNASLTTNSAGIAITGNSSVTGTFSVTSTTTLGLTTIQGITIGLGGGAQGTCAALGAFALGSNVNQGDNVAIGYAANANTNAPGNTALGRSALAAVNTGQCIGVGRYAGAYETGALALYIDAIDRTDLAGGKAKSIIYGLMNATAANQTIRFNVGRFQISNIPTSSAGLSSGDLWSNLGIVTIV